MKITPNIHRSLKNRQRKELVILTSVSILLIAIFLLSGCGRDKNKFSDPELERNKLLWQESKISNYNFVSTWNQGGTWAWVPVLITISNGTVISMEPVRERKESERVQEYENFDTVEKMFDQIQEGYNNGDEVIVSYNKEFGYPEKIIIDSKKGLTDTGFTILISNFEMTK